MEIQKYEKASSIPDEYLDSLVDSQIECWGAKPFDEYMICENESCRALYSIEEVHGSIENYREEKDKEINFDCDECGSGVNQYYKKEEYLQLVKDYFKGDVNTILLVNNDKIEGFGLLIEKTLEDLLQLELGTRPKSYKNHLKNIDFGRNVKDIFVCINHIYVSEEFRGKGYGKKILSEMITFAGNQNNNLITETRYDSNFYAICKSIGFEEIVNDKYGYVLMELNKKGFFTNENMEKIFNSISLNFLNFKKDALKILNMNSAYSLKKNYI